jgi:hypothetical protein
MGNIMTAVFILMAGESLPGHQTDPRQSMDYDRCMARANQDYDRQSIAWIKMDIFCAAMVAGDPSVPV